VHVSAMASEIRHVLAVGRRQGAWDAVLCALAVGAAAACCASETTQPARFVALFGMRGAAVEQVRKMQEDGERHGTTLNASARGGMNVLMERVTPRQMKLGRARRQESVTRAEGSVCWAEDLGRDWCVINAVTLGCLAPGVPNGSVPLYYADSVRFIQCVWDEMERRGQCVRGKRRDVHFVARECWYFAKVWGRSDATGGARGGAGNVSDTAAFKSWKFVEPLAFCVVFHGASCRTHLSVGALECCGTDGSV
jgi:hypothetical protein